MLNSLSALDDLKNRTMVIDGMSRYYATFQEKNKLLDHRLVLNSDLNEIVYHSLKSLFDSQANIKRDMITILNNINLLKGVNFDVRQFYFGQGYMSSEQFIKAEGTIFTKELEDILGSEIDIFTKRADDMLVIYRQMNISLQALYKVAQELMAFFNSMLRNAEFPSRGNEEVNLKIERLIENWKSFEDYRQVYEGCIQQIYVQKESFESIYQTADEIKELSEQRRRMGIDEKDVLMHESAFDLPVPNLSLKNPDTDAFFD